MVSNVRKIFIKALVAAFATVLLVAAVPIAVSASSAFTSISMDRTTVNPGQTATFSVRTTTNVQYVFAMVDGTRVQGSRVSGNDWTVSVTPTRTTNVQVFANSMNDQFNAATMIIPITVTSSVPAATPNVSVTIPAAPANLAPIAIASVTETPPIEAGAVQLTVVTGAEVNEVWVNFDRVNNARATGKFARGTLTTQGTNSRTWVINFRPDAWTAQQVEIGANRTYNWPGASTQLHNLALTQPYVSPTSPAINSVAVNPRTVSSGSSTTFTINTNLDAEFVWVRDINGTEHNARRSTTSAHNRSWTVTFNPQNTGTVTVFANATRTETGAATRSETITVGHGSASIVNTPTANWLGSDQIRINVTTNNLTESVWAIMPGTNNRVQLNRTNSGTGNRTWSADVWSYETWGNILVGVSSSTGNINNLNAEDSRTISNWQSGSNSSTGSIRTVDHLTSADQNVGRGGTTEFRVRTSDYVTRLEVTGNNVSGFTAIDPGYASGGVKDWIVSVHVSHSATVNQALNLTVRAFSGNNQVDSRALPATMVR